MSLYSELRRRNVFRVAIAYLAASWLLIEVAGTLFPGFGIPDWAFRFVVIVLAIGFLPTLVFSWAYEVTPEGLKREKEVVRDVSITFLTAKRLDRITIGLIVLAIAFIVVDRMWLSPRLTQQVETPIEVVSEPEKAPEPVSVESLFPPNSIAVLPFVNMSNDPGNEYFSDGISEELLNLLAKIPEMQVAARTSSFSFKGQNTEISEIAKRLKVAHVLEGSVRKAGDQVRITAQLIKADDGYHLWSESFDRQLDDIFAIQDEIANSVVNALKLTLLGDAPQTEPIDSEAYRLYLQATHISVHLTADVLERSNTLLKQVLSIAPDYAKAWRLLARNYAVQVDKRLIPREEGNALAHKAVMQALTIDPNLAEAHSWLAVWEAENGGDLMESARRLQDALKLEPNNYIVISHAAGFLATLGRLDETIAIQQYLLTLDPLNPIDHNNLAWNYLAVGRFDEAIATVRTLQVLSPDYGQIYSLLGAALLQKGDFDEALIAMQRESEESSRLFGLVMIYHASGEAILSDAALSEYIEKYGQDHPGRVSSLLAYRGEIDRSLDWLDQAVAQENPPDWINDCIWIGNLCTDQKWLRVRESVGRSPAQLNAVDFKVTLPE